MKLAVGFFDGVHLGHRRILGGADAALTFRNHPSTILSPGSVPPLLMSLQERLAAIAAALRPDSADSMKIGELDNRIILNSQFSILNSETQGLTPQGFRTRTIEEQDNSRILNSQFSILNSKVRALEFTEEMKGLTPQGFIDFLKREYPGLEAIRCGANWRFGAKGAGNAEFARKCGLVVEEVPFVMHRGEAVSSTRIRRALADGDVVDAAAMLGRPWRLFGEVFAGKGEGRKLGFPTLNLRPLQGSDPMRGVQGSDSMRGVQGSDPMRGGMQGSDPMLAGGQGSVPLRRGVYDVETELGPGVANWGQAPTMGDEAWKECVLEVHLLDKVGLFEPPKMLAVDFIRFIRPERRFESTAELARQIAMDLENSLVRHHP